MRTVLGLAFVAFTCISVTPSFAQQADIIPRAQDRPPNEAYSPEVAIKQMTVPPGFTVELVASEPMIVNPVAMTIDERGRFWITESLEYPRREPGKGRDRVKILEDTDGDGKMDKSTIFAEGLNIPSGIAVGGGGVWVANAPDLLFMQDTDGDGKADKTEVVLTGFGRDDTHELPNSLTWGPDGWLYGLNGVFNRSVVNYRGKTYDFTCALFRIHPKTREFELFAEGTSNPWGVAFNSEGEAFLSACVIDHLWHLTETGYYNRQGGPYPPFIWKIESIVDYKHQKAAYCGIHYFDSDAFPAEYRDKLYMGNIHGNCINVDALKRNGSTYQGIKNPDFLSANDAWFMPVSQKTGPDGSLYILDWYDRYHCYQDANRDPAGIDRLKGRLYRVRYKDTPRTQPFDLAKETDDQLIKRLASPNVYYRDIAQRLLAERADAASMPKLEALVLDTTAQFRTRMHALWARNGAGRVSSEFLLKLLDQADPAIRAWAIRIAGNQKDVNDALAKRIGEAIRDQAPQVRLQVAVVSNKIPKLDPERTLPEVLAYCGDDLLTQKIVWRNMVASLIKNPAGWLDSIKGRKLDADRERNLRALAPRIVDVWTSAGSVAPASELIRILADAGASARAPLSESIRLIGAKVASGEINGERLVSLKASLASTLSTLIQKREDKDLALTISLIGLAWNDAEATGRVKALSNDLGLGEDRRIEAIGALIARGDGDLLKGLTAIVRDRKAGSVDYRAKVVGLLTRFDSEEIGRALLSAYPQAEGGLKARIIDALTERPTWGKLLVRAVKGKEIDPASVNLSQVRRLLGSRDPELVALVKPIWGSIREERNPLRDLVIDAMRQNFAQSKGDPVAGKAVFGKLCAQCHKIYGEGQEVGPDITLNGRSSYEQLLSNVFDPSLVIGEAYQATTVATTDGRVLSGLVVENTPQRVVLKVQGGKSETIPRRDVEEIKVSKLSLMPEDLEKQLKAQEIVDLFAFLVLDKPPADSSAKPLPGTPKNLVK